MVAARSAAPGTREIEESTATGAGPGGNSSAAGAG